MRRPVPILGIVPVHAEELPDRIDGGRGLFGRNRLSELHVTLCLEMLEVLGREDGFGRANLRRHEFFVSMTGAEARWNAGTVEVFTTMDDSSGRILCSKSAYRFVKHQA